MHNIFVVGEDHNNNRKLLQAFNATVPRLVIEQFSTREDAFSKIQQLPPEAFPSLIIFEATTDSMGAEFVTVLKEEKMYRRIPVVAISTYLPAEQLNLLYQSGINCFVPKPLDAEGWNQFSEWMYLLFLKSNSI